ncbi:MAG: LPS export ABC transporter ATP-binding protein [Proteobacteria bacterium]|nr:LPS export ABC transporter ATP-binding protein [Pseudomonadota bacterium]RZO99385.1 MAG: LPS export ABC transporter ATP-binding protein [Gammaproteobacteria bacterium]|tara:strand:- start:1295 stop:2011 length:717 start_codon:yes stop_codon:yes gene_type:complete
MIETIKISKSYGRNSILKEISISIKLDEITGLLGPNGAGKTTLFYILAGLTKPSNGLVLLNNTEITNLSLSSRADAGLVYLPQEPSIFRNLSVEDNLKSSLETKFSSKLEIKRRMNEIMEEFKISSLAKQKGRELSGGQRRRVEIARSVALNPTFIMLDEPFAGIDPLAIDDLKELIQKLTEKGLGILISDHNVKATTDICKKIFVISSGNIIAEGSSKKILNDETVRKVYLGDSFEN